MTDTPTPPPPPADRPKSRTRRAPPRHADTKPSRGGANRNAPSAGAKRTAARAAASKAPPGQPAPTEPRTQHGLRWQTIAAAGVAELGAFAGLLALRGSTPRTRGKKPHQADRTNSSASFDTGIADEGTMPEE